MGEARKIEAIAASWVARMDGGPLDDEARAAFEAWCDANPRHFGAFVRLEAVNAQLRRAGALQGLSRPGGTLWHTLLPYAAAASILLALFTAWTIWWSPVAPDQTRMLATQIGEQYRAALPDGSRVELNTGSRVAMTFSRAARDLRLDAGEALFAVAHDPARPFTVRTRLGDVRAVGTVFSVRTDRGLDVMVEEGRVEVLREGQVVARIAAGERYMLSAAGEARRASQSAEEMSRALAWRDGSIAFAGETLAQASAELNRYNRVRIVVGDPRAAAYRLGGYFRATDPDAFVAALEQSLPVDAHRSGDVITLSSRE